MPEPGTDVAIIPHTGEVVSLDDPLACARVIEDLRRYETQIRELKRTLTDAIVAEGKRRFTNTMHIDGWEVKVKKSDDLVWDLDILSELRDKGLTEERWDQFVTVTVEYRVDAREASKIASVDPVYKEIIERACTRVEKTPSVSTKRVV